MSAAVLTDLLAGRPGECCPGCIDRYVDTNYDLTPQGIIRSLHLLDVDLRDVSYGGHFGKDWLPWEIDKELAEEIYGSEE